MIDFDIAKEFEFILDNLKSVGYGGLLSLALFTMGLSINQLIKTIIKKKSNEFKIKINRMLLERAKHWVQWEEDNSIETGGEWKRHQVYAKLIKEFPNFKKRDLSVAIEMMVKTWL